MKSYANVTFTSSGFPVSKQLPNSPHPTLSLSERGQPSVCVANLLNAETFSMQQSVLPVPLPKRCRSNRRKQREQRRFNARARLFGLSTQLIVGENSRTYCGEIR